MARVPIPLTDGDGYLLQAEDGDFLIDGYEDTGPQRIPCPYCKHGCYACGFTNWITVPTEEE